MLLDDIDAPGHAIHLGRRPHPLALDPDSWDALERAVAHHEQLRTLNQHLLVTRRSACQSNPAPGLFVSNVLLPAGVTMRELRSTRLSRLVSSYDPMLVAASFGVTRKAATYYLGDGVDQERLESTREILESGR